MKKLKEVFKMIIKIRKMEQQLKHSDATVSTISVRLRERRGRERWRERKAERDMYRQGKETIESYIVEENEKKTDRTQTKAEEDLKRSEVENEIIQPRKKATFFFLTLPCCCFRCC